MELQSAHNPMQLQSATGTGESDLENGGAVPTTSSDSHSPSPWNPVICLCRIFDRILDGILSLIPPTIRYLLLLLLFLGILLWDWFCYIDDTIHWERHWACVGRDD